MARSPEPSLVLNVLGLGRVGGALVDRARARGVPVRGLHRGEAPGPGPILVTTRAEHLDAVVAAVPTERWSDLVLVQNGMLRSWLDAHALSGVTRGLLFLAVPVRGAPLAPGGESPFVGPLAEPVVAWLHAIDVPAKVVDPTTFARVEAEKLLWNTVYGLLSEVLGETVGVVAQGRGEEVGALVRELVPLLEPVLGVTPDADDLAARMGEYSRSIPEWRGAVKEEAWRNGWFVTAARASGRPTPLHDAWLSRRRAGR